VRKSTVTAPTEQLTPQEREKRLLEDRLLQWKEHWWEGWYNGFLIGCIVGFTLATIAVALFGPDVLGFPN
jgi:hypothetical protein